MINNLPDNWSTAKLGAVCKTTSGGTPSRTREDYFQGDIPWVKSGELPDGPIVEIDEYITEEAVKNSSAKLFPSGSLLIALYGATVGKLGILNREATTNQAVCAVFPTDGVDTKYLFWYLRYVRSDLIAQAIGGAQPNISQGILRELEIPLAPFEQQKSIVAEIEKQFSRLDEAVANLKRVKANLKRYKAAVLKAAVEGKLTEEWRQQHPDVEPASKLLERIKAERREQWKGKGKYEEPTDPDTTNLPLLPEGWVWASLEAVTDAIGGFAFKSKEFTANGHQIVKMANIKMGKLDLSQRPSYIEDVPEDIIEKYQLVEKDILVTLTGTRKKRDYGYVVQIKEPENSLLLNQRIARLRPYISETSGFVTLALQSEVFRNLFFKHETGNVGQGNVGMKAVTSEPIPLPPLNEQTEIIEEYDSKLSVILKVEAVVDTNMHRAERLRQSILMNAFSGRFVS